MRGLDAWLTREPPEFPCDVCGEFPDNCICPECEVCKTTGDPNCYQDIEHKPGWPPHHGLVRDAEQIKRRKFLDDRLALEAEEERKWAAKFAEDLEQEKKGERS